MKQITLLFSLLIITTSMSYSQNLASHKWKDRLILIMTTDTKSELYLKQIKEFLKDEKGLLERRLKFYKITPTAYSFGLDEDNFTQSDTFYQKFKDIESEFEIILIGLDGGIKLRKRELLTLEELYVKIDGMPMRRNEIMNKRENK